MRILHTSDWHLGRSFGPVSLHADQERFLDWLVELVAAEEVDLVVVAGDVYDRAVPPTESVALLRDVLGRLTALGARVVAIAGNHDGPDRLSAYDGLTEAGGVVVRGGYGRAGEVTTLELPDGPLDVVAVPYLDPVLAPPGVDDGPGPDTSDDVQPVAAAPAALADAGPVPQGTFAFDDAGQGAFDLFAPGPLETLAAEAAEATSAPAGRGARRRTHHSVLAATLDRARAELRSPRSLVVAHAFVTGGQASDSERLLTVGGTGEVDASVLAGFSYAALGHLHRPQRIGSDTVRYSGTPLPYSFSETHPKQVLLVDLAADGAADVRAVPVPVGRAVATVRGALGELLADPAHEPARDRFVRVELTDPG